MPSLTRNKPADTMVTMIEDDVEDDFIGVHFFQKYWRFFSSDRASLFQIDLFLEDRNVRFYKQIVFKNFLNL